jgi:adenosylcobinamide kinase/adenosylcobinamide-phosphate guanylyltransferase
MRAARSPPRNAPAPPSGGGAASAAGAASGVGRQVTAAILPGSPPATSARSLLPFAAVLARQGAMSAAAAPEGMSLPRRLILIGGGVRSGKSRFAVAYARRLGPARVFLATAQAFDDEMRARIARHREERAGDFVTVEEPAALPEALGRCGDADVVVIDCLTLWLSNLLCADVAPEEIVRRVDALAAAAAARSAPTLVVTNEVGMGIVPETPLGRAFRDLAGTAHQRLAAASDEIYAALLGTILRLHPAPLATFLPGATPQ